MNRRNEPSGAVAVLAAGVLWGTVGPAQALAGSAASPAAVGGARILSGGMILGVLVLARAPRAFRALSPRTWPPLAAASAATGIFQASFFSAVDRTGAAVATAVVFGLAPVSTGLCERLVLGTRLSGRWWAGTACAVGGVALLVAPGARVHVDPIGVALSLVAGTCFGVYTVSAKVLTRRDVGMAAAVSVTLLVGGSALMPWTLADLPALAAPRSAVLVAWLGIAATAAAYMFFVNGLQRVSAATAGTLSLAEPLVAAVLAVAVLGERMSAQTTTGAVLLLGGLVVVSLPARARRHGRVQVPRSHGGGRGGDDVAGGATDADDVLPGPDVPPAVPLSQGAPQQPDPDPSVRLRLVTDPAGTPAHGLVTSGSVLLLAALSVDTGLGITRAGGRSGGTAP